MCIQYCKKILDYVYCETDRDKLLETQEVLQVLAEKLDCEQATHRHSLPSRNLTLQKKKFTCSGLKKTSRKQRIAHRMKYRAIKGGRYGKKADLLKRNYVKCLQQCFSYYFCSCMLHFSVFCKQKW